ncbi:hypothetical protein D9619_013195 [Psilocybe cf. subviscida]|uniref:CN hydrolase domain-containing protein n=1 Tax=Psilocybe cf. subviscida TaxID=2480587 RepID=A0A8H5B6N0_9AGAR|nr:hypothetical protein D9619_013195 [Psilocybe cf. subviscida]
MPPPRVPVQLRIGVLQLSPKVIGQVQHNLNRARELCKKIQPNSLDLLCLPEMALTGYVFENAATIAPHLEAPRTGVTSQFCAELAKKLGCYVFAGYPEKLDETELAAIANPLTGNSGALKTPKGEDIHQVGANSAAICGPNGEWMAGYRKTNLFETDLTWAKAGSGFLTLNLPSPLRTLSVGICNDLNPQTAGWTTKEGPYELADYCIEKKTNVLVLLNAWLDSGTEEEEETDWNTLNYWASRIRPLWIGKDGEENLSGSDSEDEPTTPTIASSHDDTQTHSDETIVVVCNRMGSENGKTFAGSSAIYSGKRGSGRPKLLDMMGRREEGVRIWSIQI